MRFDGSDSLMHWAKRPDLLTLCDFCILTETNG